MPQQVPDITIKSLRGGLNNTDPAQALHPDECTDATNVEFFASSCGERRLGCATISLTSSGLTVESNICHISQWFPTNVPTLPELIGIAVTPGVSVSCARRNTSGTWSAIIPSEVPTNMAPDVFGVVTQPLDANNFIAYRSSVDRLHLITTGSTWRKAGLAAPSAAPTAANTAGTGSFSGTRYYRVRYIEKSGSTVVRRSEPSATLTFTPSGTAPSATVTKPAAVSEGETHWEIEASLDNANFYRLSQIVVATTTYVDTASSAKTFPTAVVAAPVSNDGSAVTYVLLSNQAAALNLTGTVSNGTYGTLAGVISGRGWTGFSSGAVNYTLATIPAWAAGQNWWASPDVATAMETAAAGGTGQDYASVGTLSDAIGAYLTIPSAKFLTVDGNRLIYGGHWTDTAQMSTVGWTPVKNDPGVGNSERAPIVTTGGASIVTTENLDNYDGGPITGLAASTYGTWYAFKWQRIYSAVRTSDVTKAYDIDKVSASRGAIPGSVVRAAKADGSATIYFLDPFVGPCRLGAGGVVTVIHGLRNTWKRVNPKATTVVCCGVYYPYKDQVKWWVSVDGGNTPTLAIVLQASELQHATSGNEYTGELRGGLSLMTGLQAQAQCAAAITLTVGNQTTDIPVIGLPTPNFLQQCDTGTDDNGTAFTATLTSAPIVAAGVLNKFGILDSGLLATADANGSISMTLVRDMGVETATPVVNSLAPVGSESQIYFRNDSLVLADCHSVQVTLTDGAASKNWQAQRIDLKPSLAERG